MIIYGNIRNFLLITILLNKGKQLYLLIQTVSQYWMVFTDVVMTSAVCNAWCRKLNIHGTFCLLIFFIASNSWVCELRNSSLVTVWVANTCLVLSKEYIIWCGKDSVKVNCNSSLLMSLPLKWIYLLIR